MSEHYPGAWNAFSRGLSALSTQRLLLVALQLALAASEAIRRVSGYVIEEESATNHPVRERMSK